MKKTIKKKEFVQGRFWSENTHIPEEFTLPRHEKSITNEKKFRLKTSQKTSTKQEQIKEKTM